MKVSYCSTCKGRMWQLRRTFLANLTKLETLEDAEWIILDYASPDNFPDDLIKNPKVVEMMKSGKLKIYQHTLSGIPFSIPLAKNIAHRFATGDFVFNLDIDNFIGNSYEQIQRLSPKEFILSLGLNLSGGTTGRIGMFRSVFEELGGYDLELFGAGYDVINLTERAIKIGLIPRVETKVPSAIVNTAADTTEFIDGATTEELYRESKAIHDKKINRSPYVNRDGTTMYHGLDVASVTTLIEP